MTKFCFRCNLRLVSREIAELHTAITNHPTTEVLN